jgi:hypothetical protein
VAGKPARPREATHEALETLVVARQLGVEFPERAVEICVGETGGCAVTGTRYEKHAETATQDQPVDMRMNEIEPGAGAPVAEQA